MGSILLQSGKLFYFVPSIVHPSAGGVMNDGLFVSPGLNICKDVSTAGRQANKRTRADIQKVHIIFFQIDWKTTTTTKKSHPLHKHYEASFHTHTHTWIICFSFLSVFVGWGGIYQQAFREPAGLLHKNQQVFIVMNPIDLNLEPPILAVSNAPTFFCSADRLLLLIQLYL